MAKKTKGSVSRSVSARRKAQARRLKRAKRTVAVAALPTAGDESKADQDALVPGMVRAEPTISTGPRKTRLSGVPAPRLVSHKARSTWFQARASWPIREAPVARVITERDRVAKALPNASGSSQWEPIGPTNIGGRITSLVVDATFPDRIWAGAAGGGVWHSPDAGLTWQPQWHEQDVLNVGSLAIDPTDSNVLYCGTGEANLSADSYGGVGLYRTIDAGATWQLHASSERAKIPRRIGVIAIDPFDRHHVLIGGVGYNESTLQGDLGGLYTSTDGGVQWRRQTFAASGNYWCHSIVFHPTRRGVILATVTARGTSSGIYRSSDGGASWEQLTRGLPSSEIIGRTSLAISPSDPDVIYAISSDERSERADMVLGVFRSRNGGNQWVDVSGTAFRRERQMSYGNTIAVHPTKPNHVLCGGVDLHLTTNGGSSWTQVTRWDAERGTKKYAHADHHALVMPVSMPGRVYDGNDGGVDISDDGGRNWTNRSNGLAVTMYYDMDVAQSDPRVYGGGSQDNGTLVTTTGRLNDHFEILGGDGGWIVFDPSDANHLFATYYNLNIYRFRNNTAVDVSPPATEDEKNSIWMAFVAMSPTTPGTVFTGSSRVWRTTNDGQNWKAVSPTLDGSPITAIEIARSDTRRIYVGTENGGFFRSVDGGATWSANLASSVLPGHAITRLAAAPNNAARIFATMANFGHSHVFRSDNGGQLWTDVDAGQLPDVPHHSIAIAPDQPDTIYVCSDVGVFVSTDAGSNWQNLTRNLPRVMVVDLAYHTQQKTLSAATYGRSMFRLRVRQP